MANDCNEIVYWWYHSTFIRCITLQEARAKLQIAEQSFEQLELFRRLVL